MEKVIGLCNLHHLSNLGSLTSDRSIASTPFLGRYAFIDFTLSNFSNSGIDAVGILVQKNLRSLIKHLGSTHVWNTNTKLGSEAILYNEDCERDSLYNHDINNIRSNHWFFASHDYEYVVIAPVHFVTAINYQEVIAAHIKNKAEITLVYQKVINGKKNYENCDVIRTNKNGLVTSLSENKGDHKNAKISLNTYVINRKMFIEIILKSKEISSIYSLRDYLAYLVKTKEHVIHSYEHLNYAYCFNSLSSYLNNSLDLLSYKKRKELFKENWPIYTVTNDTPPTKYLKNSKIKNSFIANGAIINGIVENSIISRNVIVKDGAVIKNSIILTDCIIDENANLEYAVLDKSCRVTNFKNLKGSKEKPIYIAQGDVI